MILPEEATSDHVYDRCAATYGYDIHSSLSQRLKFDLAVKYLRPASEVLDVGCANGLYMRALAGRCRTITGIDINQAMLALAGKTLTDDGIANAHLLRRSASNLGFADSSFDLVYSFSTLLLVPDINIALREISRVLRADGIAVLDIAGRYNLSQIFWRLYYRRHGHFGLHNFDYKQIVTQLEDLGLTVIESHALGFLDQWRYIPGIHWCKWLNGWLHASVERDFDYRASNLSWFFPLANRWYLACRKMS